MGDAGAQGIQEGPGTGELDADLINADKRTIFRSTGIRRCPRCTINPLK